MYMHPQSHLVGDHVLPLWDAFVVLQHDDDDRDEVHLVGFWQNGPFASVAGHSDVLLDCVGLDGGAYNGVTLYEGDGVTGQEVVLCMVGLDL